MEEFERFIWNKNIKKLREDHISANFDKKANYIIQCMPAFCLKKAADPENGKHHFTVGRARSSVVNPSRLKSTPLAQQTHWLGGVIFQTI